MHQQGTKVNSKGKEVPHGVRLYSIASSRYGDKYDGKTTTLCVRRATYTDPETGKEDPAKKGICSNFLCDATPGTEVVMTGEHCNNQQMVGCKSNHWQHISGCSVLAVVHVCSMIGVHVCSMFKVAQEFASITPVGAINTR